MAKCTPKHYLCVSQSILEHKIFIIRGKKVMLDRDLAELYGVETKYLNRQVMRNKERFPEEFMFQISQEEKEELVTNWHQFESLKHSYRNPYAFTEYGVAMLASVLNSQRAIKVNIQIIRTFIRLNQYLSTHNELGQKFKELEQRIGKQDETIESIVQAIKELLLRPNIEIPKTKFTIKGFRKG